MSEDDTESLEHAWTKENLQKLLAAMKTSVPEQHSTQPYQVGLNAMNWEKVAFPPFSPEECQKKWKELLELICKIRTLTELIDEADDTISSLEEEPQHEDEDSTKWMDKLKDSLLQRSGKKGTNAASLCDKEEEGPPPKPPVSGYNLFCHEQKTVLSRVSYMSECAKKWRQMTKEQKDGYTIRRTQLQEKYVRELNEYLQTFDTKEQQRILNKYGLKSPKQCLRKTAPRFPGEPKMPPRSCHLVFCKYQMNHLKEEYPDAKERFIKVNQIWKNLPSKEKQRYEGKVKEGLHKYEKELQKWFKTRTPEEQEDYLRKKKCKRIYLQVQNPKKRKEIVHLPSDSEDDVTMVSSDEPEDLDSKEEDEEEEDDENITFDMY